MRLRLRHLVYAVLAAPLAAVLVAWSGVIGVGASSGHWAITDWFLHFAMRSSIRTAALGTEVPPLPRSATRVAAGHYATGCAPCHGAPGVPRPPAVLAMLPAPPDLAGTVGTWSDAELHRIVLHGIRYTGMPAWPDVARADEAWMMVAFLRRLPELTAEDYAALVNPPAGLLPERCAGCHSPDGRDAGPWTPNLAGQSRRYLRDALAAYATGARASGIMRQAVSGLAPRERAAIADALASATRTTARLASPPPEIALRGSPARGVPACLGCHGTPHRNDAFPILAGQPASYLGGQLRLFRDGTRGGGPYAELMTKAAAGLTDAEIEELSAWFAGR